MAYARNFFDPIEQLGRWFAEMQMAQASAERIISLIDAVPAIRDSDDVIEATAMQRDLPARQSVGEDGGPARIERIELKDVCFDYGNGRPVLDHVNLTASAGETIAIVGATGGGKSTLVNVICRFYEPTRGAVLIDGIDYRKRGLHWLQSNLGIVLQNAHVFSGSILENIRYGRLEATDEEVHDAARLAGAHEFVIATGRGLQDRSRRRRQPVVGRSAPTRVVRARDPRRSADPRDGRSDVVGRHRNRAAHPARHGKRVGGPHRIRDRAPAVDDPQCHAHRGDRTRPHHRDSVHTPN